MRGVVLSRRSSRSDQESWSFLSIAVKTKFVVGKILGYSNLNLSNAAVVLHHISIRQHHVLVLRVAKLHSIDAHSESITAVPPAQGLFMRSAPNHNSFLPDISHLSSSIDTSLPDTLLSNTSTDGTEDPSSSKRWIPNDREHDIRRAQSSDNMRGLRQSYDPWEKT